MLFVLNFLRIQGQNPSSELAPDALILQEPDFFNRASVEYKNGQLFLKNDTENFGIQLISKGSIILQNDDLTGRMFLHDDGSFQLGVSSNSFGKIGKLDIYHSSNAASPHLNLVETAVNASSRLTFLNDNTPAVNWTLAARFQPEDEKFGMYLSGEERLLYSEADSTWSFLGNLSFDGTSLVLNHDGHHDGAEIRLKNSNGDQRVSILATPTVENPGGWVALHNSQNERTVVLQADDDDDGAKLVMSKGDGITKLILDADYENTGFSRVQTDELQLTGGSDFAEGFEVRSAIVLEPGMLVSIDPTTEGGLTISRQQYDRTVAGVISGAKGIRPGMVMGQSGTVADGRHPVALAGRVYVQATEQNGRIRPGDLLTTSDEPGKAMRASLEGGRAFGAIVGKAISSMDDDGFVLVLVNLN